MVMFIQKWTAERARKKTYAALVGELYCDISTQAQRGKQVADVSIDGLGDDAVDHLTKHFEKLGYRVTVQDKAKHFRRLYVDWSTQ